MKLFFVVFLLPWFFVRMYTDLTPHFNYSIGAVGTRTHGRGTFFVNSDKESTQRKRRPKQPALRD